MCYNDPTIAAKIIHEGLNDYPDSPDLWRLLAFVEFKMHNKQEAINAARNAYTLDPSQTNANVLSNATSSPHLYFELNNKIFTF